MAPSKSKGGSCCAVVTCFNYSGKALKEGRTDLSFHRFPKDIIILKEWKKKCRRKGVWNPVNSFVCSDHFEPGDFVRDMKAEYLGYVPKCRRLKPEAIPTLNLPANHAQTTISESSVKRKNRMEAKLAKEAHDQLITSILNSAQNCSPSTSKTIEDIHQDTSTYVDYKQLYNDLLEKHNDLKTENERQKKELALSKNLVIHYKEINKTLGTHIGNLQTNFIKTNSLLKATREKMAKEVELLSLKTSKSIDNEAKKLVSSIFSQNQLDLIMKKKKTVHWSRDEISKAFALSYISKRAYIYVKNELHYPLPGLSSLQRWAKTVKMQNGILPNVQKVMKLYGSTRQDNDKMNVLVDEVEISSTVECDTTEHMTCEEVNDKE